jgi:hypothetical protein
MQLPIIRSGNLFTAGNVILVATGTKLFRISLDVQAVQILRKVEGRAWSGLVEGWLEGVGN